MKNRRRIMLPEVLDKKRRKRTYLILIASQSFVALTAIGIVSAMRFSNCQNGNISEAPVPKTKPSHRTTSRGRVINSEGWKWTHSITKGGFELDYYLTLADWRKKGSLCQKTSYDISEWTTCITDPDAFDHIQYHIVKKEIQL